MAQYDLAGKIKQIIALPKEEDRLREMIILIREREEKARKFVPRGTSIMQHKRAEEQKALATL